MERLASVELITGYQRSMASRATSLTSEDGDLISPQVLLAHLQALNLRNQTPPVQNVNVQYVNNLAPHISTDQHMATAAALAASGRAASLPLYINMPRPPRGGMARPRSNEEQVRRTVYINDVDHAVTERDLAAFFHGCGPIVDCRICGDANSVMRFAFIEFRSETSARAALSRNGTMLGAAIIKVSPSKTAIMPVNNQYLPRSEEERAAVARTVYVSNIHRAVERDALHAFFLNLCGTVAKIRLLGDMQHDTKIAFVEFATPEGAAAALKCTGALLGPLPIRVSASKTPVRTDSNRRAREPAAAFSTMQAAQLAQHQQQQQQQQQQNMSAFSPFAAVANQPMGLPLSRSLPSLYQLNENPQMSSELSTPNNIDVSIQNSNGGVSLGAAGSLPGNLTLPNGIIFPE